MKSLLLIAIALIFGATTTINTQKSMSTPPNQPPSVLPCDSGTYPFLIITQAFAEENNGKNNLGKPTWSTCGPYEFSYRMTSDSVWVTDVITSECLPWLFEGYNFTDTVCLGPGDFPQDF